jgi:uncharacterized protein
MSIVDNSDDWGLSDKGNKDAERHREKIDDAIRKNVRDVIAEESIITKKRGKKIRIPVKGLKDYRFIYGDNENAGGIGQGEGESGDKIGSKRKNGKKSGKPGDQEGDDYMETEVDIDYLINIMFEELGLPWIEEKTKIKKMIPKGWKFETISKVGIMPRVHKKRTMLEAVKRTASYVGEIMNETDCSEEDANCSLIQSKGNIDDAIDIITNGTLDKSLLGEIFIEDDDLRFNKIENDVEPHSNAVVIAMMDTSYSMDKEKKYLARSMLFWLNEFLKKSYDNVDIRFIQHTTTASIVDEDVFFHRGESGGTYCWTAFDKANYLVETEYPTNEWNVYCVYISDGEDFEPKKTVKYMKQLLDKKINMLSYNEIDLDSDENVYWRNDNTLIKEILNKWKFTLNRTENTKFYRNDDEHLLLSVIKNRDHIWPCLKHILFTPIGKG